MKTYQFPLFLLLFLSLISCQKEVKNADFTLKGFVFGTTYKITYLNAPKNYQKSIDSLFRLVNKSVSTYIPTSDISKINKGDTTVIVDKYFKEIFKKSKRIYKETNGFFDPTVGNLVNAWGFGPKKEKNDLTQEQIEQHMQFVGLDKVNILNNKVVKQNAAIYLDFNSIGKGYGIDVIARFLESKNISNYLIEIGGEIRTKGTKKKEKPWVIKLVDPIKSNSNTGYKVLNLSNKSMATSGNYRKFRMAENGKKYVHTINPKTGYALESNLLSASVISKLDCADVDGYATAFMAMGLEKTKAFIKNNASIKVILIYINEAGNLEEFTNYTYK
ncbi:FAD:protein FMN transferase [Polaribacter batillariae]|uniref:FAD:protein FMN transferase n=1 Tax=Polaribacter batillariae TaxID=2808900 RepID=A0ABX7SRC0_9FLAO|nr:FAD:protein FMN transferase [Polaribacter batillariae]QTD36686.1 FAD:protein FMN transferase [Polaribacter batillariae]